MPKPKTPSANVYWKDLPASACVEDRGHLYVAHTGRKQAVVFWHGQEAKQAQAQLWARTRSSANERCIREIKQKRDPLPSLTGYKPEYAAKSRLTKKAQARARKSAKKASTRIGRRASKRDPENAAKRRIIRGYID